MEDPFNLRNIEKSYTVCGRETWFVVFAFTLSYRVPKAFSVQEFMQNDSRTSCCNSNYCTNFQEKQVKEKDKERKNLCETLVKRRKILRIFEILLAELWLEDEYNHNILFANVS